MVFFVGRTYNQRSVRLYRIFFSVESADSIIVVCLCQYRISVRKSEYDIIASLYISESLQTSIFILDESRIWLLSENHIVSEWDGKRSLWNSRAESQFAYKEVISREQRAFHRRWRNLERLEKENIDECYENNRKDDGIKPVQQSVPRFSFIVLLLPEQPFHLTGDMMVENRDKSE